MIESDLNRVGELIPKGPLIVVHATVKGLFDYNYGYSFCSLKLLDGIRKQLFVVRCREESRICPCSSLHGGEEDDRKTENPADFTIVSAMVRNEMLKY